MLQDFGWHNLQVRPSLYHAMQTKCVSVPGFTVMLLEQPFVLGPLCQRALEETAWVYNNSASCMKCTNSTSAGMRTTTLAQKVFTMFFA